MQDQTITISGPYPEYYHGTSLIAKISSNAYFVSRFMKKDEIDNKIEQAYGVSMEYGKFKEDWLKNESSVCLGKIIEIVDKEQGKFVISQYHPDTRFDTIDEAINFLVENEGKLTFLS